MLKFVSLLLVCMVMACASPALSAQFIKANSEPGLWFNLDHGDDSFDLTANSSLNDGNAATICPQVLADWQAANPGKPAEWTGIWRQLPDGTKACDVRLLLIDLPAGHIFNVDHAKLRCEEVRKEWLKTRPNENVVWTGQWRNIEYEKRGTCKFRRVPKSK